MEPEKTNMITLEQALSIIIETTKPLNTESVSLLESYGRILSNSVYSDVDMPPFNKSAMDGYACRKLDLNNLLEVIEEIPAGVIPQKKIDINQCARIMTGAIVPEGADIVLMQEHVEIIDDKIRCIKLSDHANICYTGEDIRQGDIILTQGEIIQASHIAMLAAVGCVQPEVYKKPSIGILSTGSELIPPSEKPSGSKIRDTNGYQLAAQFIKHGIMPENIVLSKDNKDELQTILSKMLSQFDLTIVSGGVSVGDYDYVPEILKSLDVRVNFHGLLVKPGKHNLYGKKNNHYIFGMPGNPVSAYVQFEILVKPLLLALMGHCYKSNYFYLPLESDYSRKKNDQLFLLPIKISERGSVIPIAYHGSAHIHSYTQAHGIMEVPIGVNTIMKGEIVRVRPI